MAEKSKKKKYTLGSSVKTLHVVCYVEQLLYAWTAIKEMLAKISSTDYEVMAICHDKGSGKMHFHFAMRVLSGNRAISTLLEMIGVKFNFPDDQGLWDHRGVENCHGNFAGMGLYFMHLTEEAQEEDGYDTYNEEEIVTNMSQERLHDLLTGEKKTRANVRKVTLRQQDLYEREVKLLAKNLGDFKRWRSGLPLTLRTKKSVINEYKTIFEEVLEDTIQNVVGENIVRLSVMITGARDLGKTSAALNALNGCMYEHISRSGTGQLDKITHMTDAIILDDKIMPDMMQLADNYRVQVYKRQQGAPWWCGKYFICLHNLPFNEWAEKCDVDDLEAFKSRFYACHVDTKNGDPHLVVDQRCERGTPEELAEREKMFEAFRKKFDASMMEYKRLKDAKKEKLVPTPKPTYEELERKVSLLEEELKAALEKLSDQDKRDLGYFD